MNYQPLSVVERKEVIADLSAEYMYVFMPFMILIMVKLYFGTWESILFAPDWSLASCIVFGQVTTKVSKAIAMRGRSSSHQNFGLYTARRVYLVVIALAFYFGMLIKPTFGLGVAQIVLFVVAAFYHFKDGVATYLLLKSVKN
jgi:hypothetical protein